MMLKSSGAKKRSPTNARVTEGLIMKILITISILVVLSGCNAGGNQYSNQFTDEKAKPSESEVKQANKPLAVAKADENFIQLIATRNESTAEQVRKTFSDEGYQAVIQDGNSMKRVRIVGFNSKQDAETELAKMKARHTKNQLVQNAQVMSR